MILLKIFYHRPKNILVYSNMFLSSAGAALMLTAMAGYYMKSTCNSVKGEQSSPTELPVFPKTDRLPCLTKDRSRPKNRRPPSRRQSTK